MGWLPEVAFVGLKHITGPSCVIKNVMFTDQCRKYKWYSSSYGKWRKVYGLDDIYSNCYSVYLTIQLVNYGGKLVIVWGESIMIPELYHPVPTPKTREFGVQ